MIPRNVLRSGDCRFRVSSPPVVPARHALYATRVISLESPAHYSVRRLSPFQGTVQAVEVPGARALTTDGRTWQVQVLAEAMARHVAGKSTWVYFLYGRWRSRRGLTRVPIDPTADPGRSASSIDALIASLEALPPLPFPPGDNLELWLLDAEAQMPLALIASAKGTAAPPVPQQTIWQPACHGDTSFVARSVPHSTAARGPSADRDRLRRLVSQSAGSMPRAQWFLRDAEGCGVGLGGLRVATDLRGRRLHAGHFPESLVREDWPDETSSNLMREFHNWQAPWLLTLSGLRPSTRERLEAEASCRPLAVFQIRHLLPEIRNQGRIRATLVEAMLRQR